MTNLVLHITLPMGLKLTNGAMLDRDVTFDLISQLTPYYASVPQVRLTGGRALGKMKDITLACQIYQASQEADLLNMRPPPQGTSEEYRLFSGARNQYVTALAARDLLLDLEDLMSPASHVLANFSVQRSRGMQGEGFVARLKELDDSLKLYEVVLRSGGRTAPGGHAEYRMAAKGVNDWTEKTPSRTWAVGPGLGLGANTTSGDPGSATGGRGKPVSFFASPMYSPPFSSMKVGIYQTGYPLSISYGV